jgi:glycosyltransferase 2 family protein
MRKYRNQIIVGIIFALGIYILMLLVLDQGRFADTDGIRAQLAGFAWPLVGVLLLFQLLVVLFRFVEWQYYLGVIGARDKISLLDSAVIFVSCFTMVVSPGKAAEILKAVFLKAKTDVPIARSAPIVIAERVVDGLAVIALMVLTLLLAGTQLELGDYTGLVRGIILTSAALLAFGLVAVQIKPLAYFVLGMIAHVPLIKRLHEPLTTFYESSREIFKLRHTIPMTLVGVCVYASSGLGFFVILLGFGLEPSWVLFLQTMFILGVSSAIGALSFVPNGAGVTELSNTGLLLAMVAPTHPELSPALAAAAALLQGFFHKWFRVLLGLAVMWIFRKRLFAGDIQAALLEAQAVHNHQGQRKTQTQETMATDLV